MFLAPAMLAGLLAIALPIWIHRMARANPLRHSFASLMFLRQSETQRTAKRTIRYWLLLALRVAFLILLALAFAGPLVPAEQSAVTATSARLHAIVIDQSLSMQHGERWQRALQVAQQIIAAARSGDQLTLVAASGRRMQVLHDHVPVRDAGAIRTTLQRLQPGVERIDYGQLMTTSASWLTTPRLPTQLHLISDMQQSASPLRFADLQPPEATQLQIHDVSGSVPAQNSYVSDLTVDSALQGLTARIASNATSSLPQTAVLRIDDKEVARRPVNFPAFEAPSAVIDGEGAPTELAQRTRAVDVEFTALDLAEGSHRLTLSVEPADQLPQDDWLYAVVEQTRPKVLLISRATGSDEAAYFNAAIASLTAPRLDVQQLSPQELSERRFNDVALAVESDIAALPDAALTALDAYVTSGGSVLMTLVPGSDARPTRLLDGLRIGEVVKGHAQVVNVQRSHPVLRDSGDWHRVQFFRHLRVEPGPEDKVLMALADGAPLLIERQVGSGRVLLLTTPLDRAWNDLAIHAVFVRFLADAARYLIGHSAVAQQWLVGAPVITGLTANVGGQIFDPQGKRVLSVSEATTSERLIPTQAGFYEVRGNARAKWLAINTDRRESQLERMSPMSVQRWRALRPQTTRLSSRPVAASSEPATVPHSFGYALLALAALLGAAELLMANHYLIVRRDTKAVT